MFRNSCSLSLYPILKQLLAKTVYSSSPTRLVTILRLFISGLCTIFRNNYLPVDPIPRKRRQKKKNNLSVSELSLCYSFNYQISKEETIFFNETGQKRKNFRWNLDIPTSLNRDLRNIPFLRGGERGEGGGEGEKEIYLAKNISTVTWFETSAQYYCFP